jgi:hypothetical protein
MSWRLLFATLLIALGASAWGGIQLGDWLVAHAPPAAPAPGQDAAASQQPVLDANGRPYVAQPPQPRIDGTLGVPDKPADREWQVNTVSLFDTVSDPAVKLSRERITSRPAKSRLPRKCRCRPARRTSPRWICRCLAPLPPSMAAKCRPVATARRKWSRRRPLRPTRRPRPAFLAGRTHSSASWPSAPRKASSSVLRAPGTRATSTVRPTEPGARWPNARPVRSNSVRGNSVFALRRT